MKSHLAKLSLALLSAVFLFGCQEQGSEPVGPEGVGPQFAKKDCAVDPTHPGCKDDDDGGGPQPATLDLAFGMQTTGLDVTVKRDNSTELRVGNTEFEHAIQMNFTELGECTGVSFVPPDDDEIAALKAELERPVTEGFFVMSIDKTSLGTTGGHVLLVQRDGTFVDPTTGHTRITLGGHVAGPVKVVEGPADVFEWTGPVGVSAKTGSGRKSGRAIACPGIGDDPNLVTATLNR